VCIVVDGECVCYGRQLTPDLDALQREYCWRHLANMNLLCRRFYASGQTQSALDAALGDRENFASAVRYAAQNLISADAEVDDGWWHLASVEGVTFLREFLPADALRALFDALERSKQITAILVPASASHLLLECVLYVSVHSLHPRSIRCPSNPFG